MMKKEDKEEAKSQERADATMTPSAEAYNCWEGTVPMTWPARKLWAKARAEAEETARKEAKNTKPKAEDWEKRDLARKRKKKGKTSKKSRESSPKDTQAR